MKNLLLLTLLCLFGVSANAQLSCSNVNAAIGTSISGGTVTLTNNSSPTATSNIYTFYTITWGDNNTSYTSSNSSLTHTYNTSGTYTITLYQQVLDSINNITCYDTTSTTVSITTSLNCNNVNAAMQVYRSGNNLGVLNNYSTPNAGPGIGVSYHIVWGDSNTTTTSSKNQQTHSYTTSGTFYVKLYLTVHDSNNNITCSDTATDSVIIPSSGGGLNCGNVNAIYGKTLNGSTVTVYNYSTPNPGSGISASYLWVWGDGSTTTTSSKAARTHTYSATGTYTISLIATYSNSTITCIDSTSDTLYVNTTPPNKISGTILTDSTSSQNRDTFKVWLITFDSNTNILAAVDSQIVSGYAYIPYVFNNKSAGQYRTKAHHLNGPSSGSGYVPTYHDSDLLWSNANVINHNGGNTAGKNIYMKKGTVTSGPGFIGGNVNQGANKGTANGIEGLNILLLDAAMNPVAFTITDANGAYSFSNLPNATYYVHPEQLAFATTPASIAITVGQSQFTAINFERSEKNKTISPKAGSVGNVPNALPFAIYPNPAKNMVTLSWATPSDDNANIAITDVSGKKVLNTTVKMNGKSVLDVSTLQSGFYMMNVSSEKGSSTQKLILQ